MSLIGAPPLLLAIPVPPNTPSTTEWGTVVEMITMLIARLARNPTFTLVELIAEPTPRLAAGTALRVSLLIGDPNNPHPAPMTIIGNRSTVYWISAGIWYI